MSLKRNYWKMTSVFLIIMLLVVACSEEEEPTATPVPEEPTPVPQVEEQAVETPAEAEPAVEEAPEISQPIYRWGEVADRLWVLVAYDDAANPTVVEEGLVMTAAFSSVDGQVSGSGGCNNYFTSYESTDDGGLTVSGPIAGTMMFCEGAMDAETAYFAALETVTGWALTEEGRLELTYDGGQPYEQKLIYAPGETSLVGTTWNLVSYGDPDDLQEVLPGTSITAVFLPETDTTGTVGGSATCNSYSTSYTIDDDQISFGPIAGTLMMCPIGADQEQAFLAALETAQTYQIVGPNMQITYDGGVLNFTSLNLPLENVLWQALLVNGQPVPEGVEITVLFTTGDEVGQGTVGGSAGCNNYNTSYETSEDISTNPTTHFITIGSPMVMTMAICPDEALAELEQTYIATFESAETYVILGDQLVIEGSAGEILYTADREPLVGTLWQLISLGSIDDPQPPVEGSDFTAQFNRLPTLPSGTMTGGTGCNEYNAIFTSNLNEIKINLPSKTNNEDCPWGAGNFEVEQQFFLGLNSATEYRILGNVLQIPYDEGQQVLNFQATVPEPEGETALDLTPLDDTFWYLLSIGDNPVLPYTEITAGFQVEEGGVTGAVSGSGGCNAYNAAINSSEGAFTVVGPIASTQKACPEEVMEQEGGYFDWLSKAFDYSRAGDQLLISTANGVLTYNSTPVLDQSLELQNKTWYLVSAGTLATVPGSNATTIFNADGTTISGNTGCNEFSGSYRTEPGNGLTISGFSSTRAACASNELTRQEEAMLIFLPSAVSFTIYGTSLQIQTVDGNTVNYTSVPPAAPVPPTAVINGPDQADSGQPLAFDGSTSTAGSTPIVRYEWDMGDGTLLTGAIVQYAYGTPGSYQVSLTVFDQAGQSNTATLPVLVRPVVDVTPPTAVIEGPQTAFVGESVSFSAANSTQGTGAIASYIWDSGDGNNTGQVPENTFTTIYAQPGTYYVSVTVVDANGLSNTASLAILITANLEGPNWILQNTIPGTSISLVFENGFLSGLGGCNSYNAQYITTLAAGQTNGITVGTLTSTGSLCSDEIMNQEQAYFTTLQAVTTYTISGNTLTLTTADGTPLVFSAAVAVPF